MLEVMNMTKDIGSDGGIGAGIETHGIQAAIAWVS